MAKRTDYTAKNKDLHGKAMLERVETLEKNLDEMCQQLFAYTRRVARVRDEGDLLANVFVKFGESENINKSLRAAMLRVGDHLAAVQDYRHVQVQRLESKVIGELCACGDHCASAKESVKKFALTKEKGEVSSSSRQSNNADVPKVLALQVDRFELKKLSDLKKHFAEFIQIEMIFHAKAIEMMTRAFGAIKEIDEKEDLEHFRAAFGLSTTLSGLDIGPAQPRPRTGSVHSLRRFSSTPEMSTPQKAEVQNDSDDEESGDDEIDPKEIPSQPRRSVPISSRRTAAI